ncbi:MAG: hypothetical protein MPW14_20570 [Candidatus Manganitrophus sp.]|nr:MAG: hypothetical protein MPW14_20570 [Candidatus Manganitrophus sp.]
MTVDASLHPRLDDDLSLPGRLGRDGASPPSRNKRVPVLYDQDRATVRIDLPPAGMAILA